MNARSRLRPLLILALVLALAAVAFFLGRRGPRLDRVEVVAATDERSPLVAPAPAPGGSGAVAFAGRNAPGLTIRFEDGSEWRPYEGKLADFHYAWSPDGTLLAFRAEQDPDRIPRAFALMVADRTARKVERVSDYLPGLGRPAWRATSGQLELYAPLAPSGLIRRAYPVAAPASLTSLAVYERDGEIWVESEGAEPRPISRGGGYAPLLSPDGKRVLYAWADGIYVASLEDPPAPSRRPIALGVSPCWSPDGRRIAYCRVRDAGHEGEGQEADIFVLDLATPGDDPVAVTHTPTELEAELAWPEPDRIVYSVRNDGSIREARIRP